MHHTLGRAGYTSCPPPTARPPSTSSTATTLRPCLLDASLPMRNGSEIMREVRDAGRHDLKVIVMTARCVGAEIAQVRRVGAVACLARPFSLAELVHHVRAHVGPERPATR